jgi:glycosyltransferase involved in cell wall biosynthesis
MHVTGLFFSESELKRVGFLGKKVQAALLKRSSALLPPKSVYTLPFWEIYHALILRAGKAPDYLKINENFQRAVARRFAPPDVLICYDTSAAYLFEKWKGKTFSILDLTIGLPQYRLKVDYGDKYEPGLIEKQDAHNQRIFAQYIKETSLADLILCGSEFVKQTCIFFDVPEEKCVVLNYGVEASEFSFPTRDFNRTKLRYAFVGILGYRKGVDLLLKVWQDFILVNPGCELHFFGEVMEEITPDTYANPSIFVHGRVPKEELIKYLRESDVFVFPTTFEGSSYAVYQAMAMQLPIITTLNSGSVIQDRISGLLVKPGDYRSLLNAMQELKDHPELRKSLAQKAFALSKEFTWERYGKKLCQIIQERVPALSP